MDATADHCVDRPVFHVRYTERGVSYLLHRIGWSPQVPVHRAAERDEKAIVAWREETWSRVRRWPERLHTGEFGFGLLLGAMAVGGVLGSLLSRRAIDRFGGRAVVTTTILLPPLAQLAIGAVARDAFTVGALAAVCSCCASLWNVATVSLRQRTVPAELIGRVSNTGLTVAWGAQPMGALLGGLIAGGFGLAAPWIVAGALRLSTALLALPALRRWPSRNRPP